MTVLKGMVEISPPSFLAIENGGMMLLSTVASVLVTMECGTETKAALLSFFVQSGIRQGYKCNLTGSKVEITREKRARDGKITASFSILLQRCIDFVRASL